MKNHPPPYCNGTVFDFFFIEDNLLIVLRKVIKF